MAYDATITTEDEVDVMSGENVDVTGATADRKAALVKQAEAYISNLLNFDVTDGYSNLDANFKKILNEYGARYAATALIAFNMATIGTTSLIEPEDMIQLHIYRMEKIENTLKDENTADLSKK